MGNTLSVRVRTIRETTLCVLGTYCCMWSEVYTFIFHFRKTLSLSLSPSSYNGKVEHYRVQRNEKNWVTVDDEEFFENLVKLVEVRLIHTHAHTQPAILKYF